MKKFSVTIDATLTAEDIDDAIRRIAAHFQALVDGLDEESVFDPDSRIEIKPQLS